MLLQNRTFQTQQFSVNKSEHNTAMNFIFAFLKLQIISILFSLVINGKPVDTFEPALRETSGFVEKIPVFIGEEPVMTRPMSSGLKIDNDILGMDVMALFARLERRASKYSKVVKSRRKFHGLVRSRNKNRFHNWIAKMSS